MITPPVLTAFGRFLLTRTDLDFRYSAVGFEEGASMADNLLGSLRSLITPQVVTQTASALGEFPLTRFRFF